MHNENQKALKTHELLIATSLNWVSEAHQAGVEIIEQGAEQAFDSIIESYYGDDPDNRQCALALRNMLRGLIDILNQHDQEDFKQMDLFNYKFSTHEVLS